MHFLRSKWNSVANSAMVSTIKNPTRTFPLVDTVIILYAAVTILFQILFQISPVMSFLVNTPLYEMQTYLGLLGGALIVLDVFTTKKIWNGKYSFFLYSILVLAVLSSARMLSYGVKENLFKICWMAIQFVLIYTVPQRMSRETLKKFVKIVFFTLLTIWVVSCCVSLYQYVNQIGYTYVVNPLGKDSSANRQGFYDNRLFGIFYTLNTAANTSLLFFLINFFFILKEKKLALKIALCIAEVVLICHIILAVSRSAMLSLFVCSLVLAWFLVRNKIGKAGKKKVFMPIAAALVTVVIIIGGYNLLKTGLTYLPHLNEKFQIALQESTKPTDEQPGTTGTSTSTTLPSGSDASTQPTTPTTAPSTPQTTQPTTPVAPEYNENILERDNLADDYSNDRFNIWRDYISLYKDIGLLGFSPNYMPYIIEHHPDLFIVENIRIDYPDKYESGIIYHGHSGYLIVFIATGFLGAFSLLAFIGLCVYHVIKTIRDNKKLSLIFICSFLLVIVGALSAALDEGLFFQNSPQTTLFYFALGTLMNTTFYKTDSNEVSSKELPSK